MNKYSIDVKDIIPIPPEFMEEAKKGLVPTHDLTQDFESFALMFIQKQDGQVRKGQRIGQGWQLPLSFIFEGNK